MIEAVAPAARWRALQVIVWGLLSPSGQVTPVAATESTMSRPSTVSVRLMLSASETPVFLTLAVNVLLAPPAVTVALSKVLVTSRTTSSTMSTVSLPVAAVSCSSEVALAVLLTLARASVVVSTLYVTVIDFVAPAPRWARLQSSAWPTVAAQLKSPLIGPTTRSLSTVSVTLTLSASEVPVLVTSMVNVWLAPPAVTVALLKVFVTARTTSSTTAFVSDALLLSGSVSVVVEPTVTVFVWSPLSVVDGTV